MLKFEKKGLWLIATILQLTGGSLLAQQANKPNSSSVPVATFTVPIPGSYTQPVVNYVRTWDAKGQYLTPEALVAAGYQHSQQTTMYVDGLGRPLQTVSRQSSPLAKDVVSPVVYDGFGREIYKYLPYVQTTGTGDGSFKLNPFSEQASFYQSSTYNPGLTGEQVFFSKTDFEPSPLNRVTKSMAPGNSWAGSSKGTNVEYLVNNANDNVQIWTIGNALLNYTNDDGTNIPVAGVAYGNGQLYKNVTKDENNNVVVEYKDKEGQIILKKVQIGNNIPSDYSGYNGFLCTYYIYDDLNKLRVVVPPKAVETMVLGGWTVSQAVVKELCFRYEYDERQRMIAKKVPGAGWAYMVYDRRDRLVFTQDANQQSNNKWLATLYDGLNRPVTTGMITYTGKRDQLQVIVDTQTGTGTGSGIAVNGTAPINLEFATRELSKPLYKAKESITFLPGFESEAGADFSAEIDPNMTGGTENIEILDNPLPPNNNFIPLTITYYDNYGDWVGNKTYSTDDNGKLSAGNNFHAEKISTAASQMTKGVVTGTKVRVLENPSDLSAGGWLTTVSYYDDQGRTIQVQSDNYKGGKDVATNLYDFTGKVLSTYLSHQNPTSDIPATRVKTNMLYDFAGRLLEINKTINDNNNSLVTIAKNEYDELGQLKKKELGQQKNGSTYTSTPIETLNHSYNIRGWLRGINKDYATGSSTNNWFGMELNYDHGFDLNQVNGNIAGAKWRSKGDGQQRAYGYSYDRANRILGADFSQGSGTTYADNPTIRFDMVMGDGVNGSSTAGGTDGTAYNSAGNTYDANGNIMNMKHWGMKGLNTSIEIDNLTYQYYNSGNSNKLRSVSEVNPGLDNKLGDFTDKNTGDDYGYDQNGNLITDLNKKMGSTAGVDLTTGGAIQYNHLNLPAVIAVKDDAGNVKGTITYIYDASGNKLEKRVHELPLASNSNKTRDIATTYLGGFNYETRTISPADPATPNYDNKLQFFGQEEGRVRVEKPASETSFHYDYFVKDHLGNVRMVLTDELQTTSTIATMELAPRTEEEKIFSNITSTVVLSSTVPGGYPTDTTTNPNNYLSKLNGSGNKIGPSAVLKVMSGDKLNIAVKYFYRGQGAAQPPANILANVLTSLATGIIGNIGEAKGTLAALSNPSGSPLAGPLTTFTQNDTTPTNRPKAKLNYVFLDDQFNVLPNSSSILVGGPDILDNLAISNLVAAKNGFVYIYVSNETPLWDVFFDNLLVTHTKSPLLEETHYYPFGLTMAGLSSKGVGQLNNKYKYNGIEHNSDFDLNMYDAFYRNLDPQLGNFWQIDPKIESAEAWSPYSAMLNNPIRYADPLGDSAIKPTWHPPMPSNSSNVFSATNWYGVAAIKNDNVRVAYNSAASQLAPSDKKGRADLKQQARAVTPEPFKTIVEQGRPMAGEQAKVTDANFKGNATKTNAQANELVKNTGTIGKVLVVGGAINSAVNIAKADNPGQQAVVETGSWVGAIQGGSYGAELGSAFGPGGAFVGGVLGAITGSIAGSSVGQWLNNNGTTGDSGKEGGEINGKFIKDAVLNKR
jgi:RHS repeat-associated protein